MTDRVGHWLYVVRWMAGRTQVWLFFSFVIAVVAIFIRASFFLHLIRSLVALGRLTGFLPGPVGVIRSGGPSERCGPYSVGIAMHLSGETEHFVGKAVIFQTGTIFARFAVVSYTVADGLGCDWLVYLAAHSCFGPAARGRPEARTIVLCLAAQIAKVVGAAGSGLKLLLLLYRQSNCKLQREASFSGRHARRPAAGSEHACPCRTLMVLMEVSVTSIATPSSS